MAPERLKGASLNGRSDIFATGVLLYQFLTGQLPFIGDELVLFNKLLNEKPLPLSEYIQDYPSALDAIIDRSLEKNPSDRYQSADEMATDLSSVIETLKKEYSSQIIAQAEQLSIESDFVGARNALLQLLKLDNQHTQARRLLVEVNQHLTLKVRAEQVEQKRYQAEDALRDKNYDLAVTLLEEATRLVPDDQGIAELLVAAKARKETSNQILGYLRQADAAKKIGDYRSAQEIVEKALKLDTNNSRLRAAYGPLLSRPRKHPRRLRPRLCWVQQKNELKQRNYLEALAVLKQADEIVPSDPDLQDLRDAANQGLLQAVRRKLLDRVEKLLSSANTREDLDQVALIVNGALEKAPSDPTLLRYRAQLDAEIREYESKMLIDATAGNVLPCWIPFHCRLLSQSERCCFNSLAKRSCLR